MIEREVQVPEERPVVAAVIYNRLKQDIPLQIDATAALRARQLRRAADRERPRRSTRPTTPALIPGLPPTPIGNPGLDSLDGRRRTRPTTTTSTTSSSRGPAASTSSPPTTTSSSRPPRSTTSPRPRRGARRPSAERRRWGGEPPRRRRTADRALALAGDAHGRLPGARASRASGATRRSSSRPEGFAAGVGELRERGFVGRQRDDSPQGGGARRWPTRLGRRDGDRRREHAQLRPRTGSRRRTPTLPA